jgi:hypothetical protein
MTVMSPRLVRYTRPWLADYQKTALFGPKRYALVEATTKAGKTVGCMVWLTEKAMQGRAGQNFWWVAPIFPQAKIAFRRLKRALPREVYTSNEQELTITLLNGAVIWFKGADKPDSLYGEDVYAAVIDEASRCKEEAWHAVRSTLTATRGPIRIIGNVKGRRNWAYVLARKAESGSPDMSYAKITAHDAVKAGILTAEEIEDARLMLPEAVFRELYMAEPSDDAGNPFGVGAIRACIRPALSKKPAVAYGLDLAKSSDWAVLIGLDEDGAACYYDRWQGPWEATIPRALSVVGKVPTQVDSTGVGDPVLESMQKKGRDQGARLYGFTFSQSSKQKLMEGLAVAIQQKQISYPDDAHVKDADGGVGQIVAELESFEFEYTRTGVRYSAPEGLHDDCVCSLALAVHQFTRKAAPVGVQIPDGLNRPSQWSPAGYSSREQEEME